MSQSSLPQTKPLAQRAADIVAAILTLSGGFHVLVLLWKGGSWAGPLSWRKPILFGFSAGATVFSIGWLLGKLNRTKLDTGATILFSTAMLVEVALITLQTWRGVPSHFNRDTPVDAQILNWIEALILVATAGVAYFTYRSFGRLHAERDMRLAIRSGMLLLLFACLFGMFMVSYGNQRVIAQLSPEVYGKAGVMKFPHGTPIHAIQFFPLLSWMLRRLAAGERRRFRCMLFAIGAMVLFTVFSLMQTFGGRDRMDVNVYSTCVVALSAVLLLPVGLELTRSLANPFYRYRED